MTTDTKYTYRKTIRINSHIKSIIEKNFKEIRKRTGLKLSYGKISRVFWSCLAADTKLRDRCMDAVCKSLLKDAHNNAGSHGRKS